MRGGRGEVDALGVFVHGMLTGLHALGAVYNLRRGNWSDAVIHAAAAAYDVTATFQHARACENDERGGGNG